MSLVNSVDLSLPWSFENGQFNIRVSSKQALLGNSNHVRLILENLLKNAQHFHIRFRLSKKLIVYYYPLPKTLLLLI
jgi:hypothetical protein